MRWPWQRRAPAASAEPADVAKAGSAGLFSSAPVAPATQQTGADGTSIVGGFLISGERDPRLNGRDKWVLFDEAIVNIPIVGAAVNIWTQLAGSAKWSAESNPEGGKDAERAVEIVTKGLLDAQLSTPWNQIVRRQSVKRFRGFAMHEAVVRRRPDGMVVVGDLADRPQWTIWRWDKPNEQTPLQGVEQLTRLGKLCYIPRERLLYSVENTLTPSPDGLGILRQVMEPMRVLQLYQQFEGIGFQNELRGIPIVRAPLGKLKEDAQANGNLTPAAVQAYITGQIATVQAFAANHGKNPQQGMVLDSATFTAKDAAQSPSSIPLWDVKLLTGGSTGQAEIHTAQNRIVADIARLMCAEWLLMGSQDAAGAYQMHADKTAMFALCVNSVLQDIAGDAKRDIATRLVALNGLDPETCTPTLRVAPVSTGSVLATCQALASLFGAGLDPRDKAIPVIRDRLDLPPPPDVDEATLLLPRGAEVAQLGPDGRILPSSAPAPMAPGGPSKPSAPGAPTNPGAPPGPEGVDRVGADEKPPSKDAPGKPGNSNAETQETK